MMRRVYNRISRDFTWDEMTHSRTAEERGIENEPGEKEERAIEELVKRLLQPLRQVYGKPIRISSGYRCPELNKLVGGAPSSQHVKGEAADCVAENGAGILLELLLLSELPFDQAILYPKRNFLHLSLRAKNNRRQTIIR